MQHFSESLISYSQSVGRYRHGLRRALFVFLIAIALGGCSTWPAKTNFRPQIAPKSPLNQLHGRCFAMQKGVDARVGMKQIGMFDPNNLEPLNEFKLAHSVPEEVSMNVERLLVGYGLLSDSKCNLGLRVNVPEFMLSGRRSFGKTKFNAALAFDVEVMDLAADFVMATTSVSGRANTTGTGEGSQDNYYNAALTNAVARAMEQLAGDAAFASALATTRTKQQ
jgi:hypothetical protein